ncbi:hypothetical protein LTR84_000946 [Exophiala bonariae]|uniref:O-methyltransferase C-terminal domain-containing protein n=1 Tax=Exophiala bonariae TaxID=1690606 RepID=A0AAV9NSK4_9EURO|nr:hypothetical protein LTR84_000946 [Exophiala bonariae]
MCFEAMIPTSQGLPEFLAQTDYQVPHDDQKGLIQYGLRTDKSFFGVLQENQRLGAAFNRFTTVYAQQRPRWVDFYPCEERLLYGMNASTGPLLVDVGGGLSGEIRAFHTKYPMAPGRLILEDLPNTISQVVATDPPLPAAVEPVEQDLLTPQPLEYQHARAYFRLLILHDWPEDKCRAILSHLRNAMKLGYSEILINKNVLPGTAAPWQQTSLVWTMMAMLASQERTRSQWSQMLMAVGLKIVDIYSIDPTSESLIEATLPDK